MGPVTPQRCNKSPRPSPRLGTNQCAAEDPSRDARTPSRVGGRLGAMHTPDGAAAKRSAGEAGAPSRGTGSRLRRKKRGRCGTPGSRSQQGVEIRAGVRMQGAVEMKLAEADADADYDKEQTLAKSQARARKEEAAAADADARRRPGVGGVHGAAFRRKRGAGSIPSTAKPPGRPGVRQRARACGLHECGWVSFTPGAACSKCPTQQVHEEGQKLCSACHRPTDDFTHLLEKRRAGARRMTEAWRSERKWPTNVVANFQPGKSCLCQRDDCFIAALKEWETRDMQVRCVHCGAVGRRGQGCQKWRNVTEGGGHAVYSCVRCYTKKRRSSDGGSSVASGMGERGGSDGAPGQPRRDPQATVREVVAGLVGRGEIVCGEDVIRQLGEERAKVGLKPVQHSYARKVVKEMFRVVATAPDNKARVVESFGGRGEDEDGREKPFYLFPTPLNDDVLVGYFRRARQSNEKSVPERRGGPSEAPLDGVERSTGGNSARMEVVRRAARIVQEDVENKECLKNAPGRGKRHRYREELGMPVKNPRETLLDFPETLVALVQGVTGFVLRREVVGTEREGACFAWEEEWREEVLADVRESRAVTEGSGDNGGGTARTSPSSSPSSGAVPETVAAGIDKENRDSRSKHRRVYMIASMLAKAVLGDNYIASHDIKGAQWASSKGCPRTVIDFCAGMGLWATTARVQHREDWFVKQVDDKDVIDGNAECAAIPMDNCDKDITVGVAQGEGPHFSCVAATISTLGPEVGSLEDASKLRKRKDLTLGDVLDGREWEKKGRERLKAFKRVLYASVIESVRRSSDKDSELTCLEAVLRKNMTPEKRAAAKGGYMFIMKGSTKKFSDMRAAALRAVEAWRASRAGKDPAPVVIAGDEETYRFFYHLQTQEPGKWTDVRRYPGDWHIIFHILKAIFTRFWGAGIELVAMELGTDNVKASQASNCRRAHHQVTVMFEALITLCREEYTKTFPLVDGVPVGGDDVDGLIEWIKVRAEGHKTFALWEQFLLHVYPAYIAFRTAVRTGDFLMRLAALREIAPIFYITGKDRYQFMVADHLAEMARLSESDMKVMAELFSVSLSEDAWARLALDERQEVANGVLKDMIKRFRSSALPKMGPTAQLREVAISDFERAFIEQPRTARDRCRELARKRAPEVQKGVKVLRSSKLFGEGDATELVVALDGRPVTLEQGESMLRAPQKAEDRFRDVVLCNIFKVKEKQKDGPTKKKEFSIPARNKELMPTRRTGRNSALKDNISNAYAGGVETKAVLLNAMAAMQGGQTLSEGQLFEMVAEIGTTTPYSMANITGGAKHANKSAGPSKWLAEHTGTIGYSPFYESDAHGVDLPVSIHQGVRPCDLEEGWAGVIKYFVSEVASRWMVGEGLLLVSYDYAELVPVIKAREQSGRTAAVTGGQQAGVSAQREGCTPPFNISSRAEIPARQFQSNLRANRKEARDGIADQVATECLDGKMWEGDNNPKATLAFYGVRCGPALGESRSSAGGLVTAEVEGEAATTAADEGGPPLLFRNASSSGVERRRGPNIGEAELSLVHFVIWAKEYWGKEFTRWLITSVDTDLWMIILLAMSTGHIQVCGEGTMYVTVRKVVGGVSQYIFVNKVYEAIVNLEDGGESAWPRLDSAGDPAAGCWIPDDNDKVRLFVLVYLLAGCDFLPAISGLPFHKMWDAALKSVRAEGVFDKSIFKEEDDGVWGIDIDDCVKLLTTIFFFKFESKLKRAGKSPGQILETCEGRLSDYVNVVRFLILKLGPTRATSICPGLESMRLHGQRAKAVLGYLQDGFKKTMPRRSFNGKGWGVDPKIASSSSDELTADNCVLWLSEHVYVGVDNKTKKLACTSCDPDTALCNRCHCKNRGCTLACKCRGNCRHRRPPVQPASPVPTSSALVSLAARAFLAQVAASGASEGSVAPGGGDDGDVTDDDSADDLDDDSDGDSNHGPDAKNSEALGWWSDGSDGDSD